MKDKIRTAFDTVQAEEILKEKTLAFIQENTQASIAADSKKGSAALHKKRTAMRLIPAMACLLMILGGGSWLYFTPVASISMDINPSIEMEINRFDRVLSAEGFNNDGRELAYAVDIKHMKYTDAVDAITSSATVSSLMADGEIMAVTIVDDKQKRGEKIRTEIEDCVNKHECIRTGENAYCYYADSEEVAKAHDCGLSYGKYRALQELQETDPDITADDVQNMTMKEMHQMKHGHSSDDSHAKGSGSDESSSGTGSGQQHHYGNGNNSGNGNGNNSGSGNGNGKNHHGE